MLLRAAVTLDRLDHALVPRPRAIPRDACTGGLAVLSISLAGALVTVWTFPTREQRGLELDVLDEGERVAAARFVREADRKRYASAHVALRRVLAEEVGLAPGTLSFRRAACPGCGGPHGRPELVQEGPPFSLSHAGGHAMVAVLREVADRDRTVGVDLEELTVDQRLVADLAPSLHPAERTELEAIDPAGRPSALLRCWVRKEAVLKALGTGVGAGLDTEYVGTGPRPGRPDVADLEAPPGHVASVAVR